MNATSVLARSAMLRRLSRQRLATAVRLVLIFGSFSFLNATQAQVQVAAPLYVDLRATNVSAGTATWTNEGTLGNFAQIGAPVLETNVASTGIPGVSFNGLTDAYLGPNSVAGIDGEGDRSIEVWAFNPSIVPEETMVSWGHRGTVRRDLGFNFGNNAIWGAATHWDDDVSWGAAAPTTGEWHHLAYTYSNQVVRVYKDGVLANTKTLGGLLNTFPSEPINLACQREANGARSLWYAGYLNTVRVHGGVLTSSQVFSNFSLGPLGAPTSPPAVPTGLAASAGYDLVYLAWNATPGASRYRVKRALAGGGPYSVLASNLTATGYLDTNVITGTNYYYVLAAENGAGLSADSAFVSARPGLPAQALQAGSLYVDLRAMDASAGAAVWTNHASLGNFTVIGNPQRIGNVAQSGLPGVLFNGSTDAYAGPNSVADLDGGSDRSVEVWAYNPSFVAEETSVSWGHRGTVRRNMGFNFGNNPIWGAATHWDDDVSWGDTLPDTGAWQHLVYTYANNVVRVYVNGVLRNTDTLAGPLDTYPGEAINLACQREPGGGRSFFYGGYLNTVRVHGAALNPAQVQANYYYGPSAPAPLAVNDAVTLNPGGKALVAVLANDTASAFFQPQVILKSAPGHGVAEIKPDGKMLYTHNGSASGTDSFTYIIRTALGATSQVATVQVTISPALRLPNTTLNVPAQPPVVGYEIVDAFPGLVFEDALAIATPPGRTNQIFVAERRGRIAYVPDIHAVNPVRQVFLDVANQMQFDDSVEGEQGLLGMAFHPGFATNGYFFVYYTAPGAPAFDRLSRFTANPQTLTVNTNTQQILFEVVDQVFNHNGGDLHFGPDGYLYIGTGDEGDQYNFRQNAQRIDKDLYSALLRIDVDKRSGNVEPRPSANTTTVFTNGAGLAYYSIPADNPFVKATTYLGSPINTNTLRSEIFATGFRHIWRFSIDPTNAEIWVGDVGQDRFEEVNIVTNGGNYGWAYLEGYSNALALYPNQTTLLSNPPPGFTPAPPLYAYPHNGTGGDPQFQGNSISGGVVYHGSRIPDLAGAYVFGDFVSANLWALWRTNGGVRVERIGGAIGVAGFGIDPANGDVLLANYAFNQIQRLVRKDVANSSFPTKLSDTGVFADVTTLTPNPGVVNYEPIVAFWSDYAVKQRWFTIADPAARMTFATDGNWSFPTGMVWIKHFDLELERGNPATKQPLETRLLVRNAGGVYGVSYGWNAAGTEAYLVPDGGTNFFVNVQVGGSNFVQQWEIPSRAACLACHTPVAGHALSFNTRQLNQSGNLNGVTGNQLTSLEAAGYFHAPLPSPHSLPGFAQATNAGVSLEFRARSYLAVNCVQCHQPGGSGASTWNARPEITLDQTGLINGLPDNNGANPLNRLVVPGDTNHSVLFLRLKGEGFSRMPPLATHQLDLSAIHLLAAWIGGDLTNRQTFAEWQAQHFGSTNNPSAASNADPDGDGAGNYFEFLTRTGPLVAADVWQMTVTVEAGVVQLRYPQVPNLGVVIETSADFSNWQPWEVAGNQPVFAAEPGIVTLNGALGGNQYFRARLVVP